MHGACAPARSHPGGFFSSFSAFSPGAASCKSRWVTDCSEWPHQKASFIIPKFPQSLGKYSSAPAKPKRCCSAQQIPPREQRNSHFWVSSRSPTAADLPFNEFQNPTCSRFLACLGDFSTLSLWIHESLGVLERISPFISDYEGRNNSFWKENNPNYSYCFIGK